MSRGSLYVWLCLSTSAVAFLGFSFTYFGPMFAGVYPQSPPVVHLHGWAFFLWYLLLPCQAGLIASRRVATHRALGKSSVALATVMVTTGMVVIGTQMELTRQGATIPFWGLLGPAVFVTLLLFAGFYSLALRFRRKAAFHKRFMLLASTVALGAAAFRVVGYVIGFGATAGIAGILAPNLIVLVAVGVEVRRGEGMHTVYRWGLPISVLLEGATILLTPTPGGQAAAAGLAWMGRVLAPFY
ncbi:MAG TPA: hypothetical protein VMW48_02885 [Vicinamibacterales bacterium]|nr:hypothetical protein [Vicinamibacterales bacterium]